MSLIIYRLAYFANTLSYNSIFLPSPIFFWIYHSVDLFSPNFLASVRGISISLSRNSLSTFRSDFILFCSQDKSTKTKYCDVDMLILKDNKIRVIIEIEEANVKPTQICGKFLVSALSSYYIHRTGNYIPINKNDSVSFIQIVDISKLKKKKRHQK